MPANRSRTSEWRRCLQQISDRNGAIEIAIARTYDNAHDERAHDLVWRVRALAITDSEIVVEQPIALGKVIAMETGLDLVGVLSIGQNRWTFNTTILGKNDQQLSEARSTSALRLQMPELVQRCQRRNYYRVSTTLLSLPAVEVWPLIDPASVVVAERANELQFEAIEAANHHDASGADDPVNKKDSHEHFDGVRPSIDPAAHDDVMPDVGPKFSATLLNVGGGGLGLLIDPEDAHILNRHKLFWLRVSLPPHLEIPVCATGKLVHTHMESSHQTYAGMAFDFTFNPSHQRFVVDQICRYIAVQQREQLRHQQERKIAAQRKSA